MNRDSNSLLILRSCGDSHKGISILCSEVGAVMPAVCIAASCQTLALV